MSKQLIGTVAVCVVLGGLLGMGGCAAVQPGVQLARVSALPQQCRDGCSLTMVTAKFGWLKGRTTLWATNDGGASWQQRTLPRTVIPDDFLDIHFVDEQHGWLLASSGPLYETSDSGLTWVSVPLPQLDGLVHAAWLLPGSGLAWLGGGIYKPSKSPHAANYCLKKYESGLWGIKHPAVLIRKGAGAWDLHELPGGSCQVMQLRFWDQRHGFAIADTCFYYTETGGQAWTVGLFTVGSRSESWFPDEGREPTVSFLDRENGWLGLNGVKAGGSLYRTADGGQHWVRIASSTLLQFKDLVFTDQTHGLGIGSGYKLYQSRDGGVTWALVNTAFLPSALYSLGGRTGWVLSDDTLYTFAFF